MTNTTREAAMTDQPKQNTDREIWREREGDYYADSIHVTEGGGIGLNCGGYVIVQPIRVWHASQQRLDEQAAELRCGGSGFIAIPSPSPGPPEGEFCRGCPDCEPSPAVQRRITKLEQQLAEREQERDEWEAQFDLVKENGRYNWKQKAEAAEAKVQRLEAERTALVGHIKHYLGPDFGTPTPEHEQSFLVHSINHLGGLKQDYVKVAHTLEELRAENAEQVEGLQLIANLVGGAGGLLDAAFLAGMVQAELERAARENVERERKAFEAGYESGWDEDETPRLFTKARTRAWTAYQRQQQEPKEQRHD